MPAKPTSVRAKLPQIEEHLVRLRATKSPTRFARNSTRSGSASAAQSRAALAASFSPHRRTGRGGAPPEFVVERGELRSVQPVEDLGHAPVTEGIRGRRRRPPGAATVPIG